jgi:Predicted nuclease of the RecB family
MRSLSYLEKVGYNQYRLRQETVDIEPEEEEEDTVEILRETRISLEHDLESFIVEQIQTVENGLKLKEPNYRQVSVNSGRIDVLAEDSQGNTVIIELKAGQARDRVLAQTLAYMSDMSEVKGNTKTRGIVIAHSFSDRLLQAVKMVPMVKLLKYSIKFEFEKP